MKVHKLMLTAVVLVAATVTAFAQPDMTINIGPNAVLFREDGAISVWTPVDVENGIWMPVLTFGADEIEAYNEQDLPEVNTIIVEEDAITLERLDNGQWQVSTAPNAEGKVDVVVFESDFTYAHQYVWSVYGDEL